MRTENYLLWDNTPGLCEETPTITVYYPDWCKHDITVIIFPGGGYRMRAEHQGKDYAEFLADNGYTTFVVDYRVELQIINVMANLMRLIESILIGKYSDRNSFTKDYKLALCVTATAFFVNIFTTNDRWWLVVVFTVLFNCSYARLNQNLFNITYNYVDSKYITQAIAVKNCIGGVCGFIASIAGGKVLDRTQSNGNILFGINIYRQKIMSTVSFVITISAAIFVHIVIEKQKVKR